MNIKGKLFLAPLAGITDSQFRKICREQGADIVCTELISSNAIAYKNPKTLKMLTIKEDERPIGIQLFGSDCEIVKRAVEKINLLKPDFIDINMGCSVKKINKSGAGSVLLKNIKNVFSIASAVKKNTDYPVSAKIRLGYSEDNAEKIALTLQDAGVSFITVHGRLAKQRFSGKANWERIDDIKKKLRIPVIGNGDIFTWEQAVSKIDKHSADAIMIARGALGNPWIFRQIKEFMRTGKMEYNPSTEERIMILKSHYESGNTEDIFFIRSMRKHFHWYTKCINNIRKYRNRVNEIDDYSEIRKVFDEILQA